MMMMAALQKICADAGTFWTATSHIITAVIGSGVLSLAWAIGQLGWVAGPAVMLLFAFVILYTSNLLSQCYRSGNPVTIPFYGVYQLNFFRLLWRTAFVILTTVISMLLPFFNDVVGLLGALGFWPLTVYFPVEMYIAQKKIGRWTNQWIGLQMLSAACLLVSIAAAVGSVAGVVLDLKTYKPFKTSY